MPPPKGGKRRRHKNMEESGKKVLKERIPL
jgi:hypothetical protein